MLEALAQQGDGLLDSIADFCRRTGMAESTFGRRAVNDGRFVARLRDGTVLTRVMRERRRRFATLPFYLVGKEISLKDGRVLCRLP